MKNMQALHPKKTSEVEFYVTNPVNNKKANFGNGTQISFLVHSKDLVNNFYNTGIKLGGKDEGAPGVRSGDYYCYLRDLDGNKICAFSKIYIKMHLIHRGIVNKSFKENILKSFQSFQKGYGVETDIHVTKDNQFICFHDFTLRRIFKKKFKC